MFEYTVYGQFGLFPALAAGATMTLAAFGYVKKQEKTVEKNRLPYMADCILHDLRFEVMNTQMNLEGNPKLDSIRKKAIDFDGFVSCAVKFVDDDMLLRGNDAKDIRHEFLVLHILSNIAKLTYKSGESQLIHSMSHSSELDQTVCCSQMQIQFLCFMTCKRLVDRLKAMKPTSFESYYIDLALENCNRYRFNKRVSLAA
ncbi:hypothetical protein [Vibrio owensii]|uniref:hypothetical protein n=1 Tax=Vibrio harveyi group TaxID=717610 RepID=UPI003CC6759D